MRSNSNKEAELKRKMLIGYFLFSVLAFCMANDYQELQKLVASDRVTGIEFGISVSISGDYAIVGALSPAYNDFPDQYSGGLAYIFYWNGTSWIQQAKILASDRAGGDAFGQSVSISGDYAIVGAPEEDEDMSGNNTLNSAGSAYIFKRDGINWIQQSKIVASDRAAMDQFGYSVSISGDYAIVGAPYEDEDVSGNNTLNSAGLAYIFKRDSIGWSQLSKIVAPDREETDYFGHSVSIFGDNIVIGAYHENEDAMGDNRVFMAGSAYVYKRDSTDWNQQTKIVASNRSMMDLFGFSISISEKHILVGAPGTDMAYIFSLHPLSSIENDFPQEFSLNQNYPNPLNPTTTISYELPEAQNITLQIFDITGRLI